jgi:signal transduction histidine kinase
MAAAGVVVNYFLSRQIWQPFFQNLKALKNYSLGDPEIALAESPISEFKEMQMALQSMTNRSRREYLSLREFTENASHEIQTPLSIVRAKLERMTQLPVTEELATYIVQAKSSVDRLSRINKDLLLLVKLENGVFPGNTQLNLEKVIERQIAQMEEMYQNRDIHLETFFSVSLSVFCNEELIDILIGNLLANALHYTPAGGSVVVQSRGNGFVIRNTGKPLPFPGEHIFDRFKKSNAHAMSNGLGLSIVQQIILLHHWTISYSYDNGWHVFDIRVS